MFGARRLHKLDTPILHILPHPFYTRCLFLKKKYFIIVGCSLFNLPLNPGRVTCPIHFEKITNSAVTNNHLSVKSVLLRYTICVHTLHLLQLIAPIRIIYLFSINHSYFFFSNLRNMTLREVKSQIQLKRIINASVFTTTNKLGEFL